MPLVSPPIALTSLKIRDFRGIDQLDLDFRGPDGLPNSLVVLAGPNGSGKSVFCCHQTPKSTTSDSGSPGTRKSLGPRGSFGSVPFGEKQ